MNHPIDNGLRALFQSKKPFRGLFNGLASPALIEMTAYAGYDFSIIDNEHGSASIETAEHMMRAARGAGMPTIVRCLEHDIARTLDAGASGIQIPMVRDAAHAKELVQRVRYPRATTFSDFKGLSGQRGCAYSVRAGGYGAFGGPAHNEKSNQEVMLVVMLETVSAIDRAAEIANVEGVDAVFIGPNDLAHSMGYENRFLDPAVQAQIERGIKAIASTGKTAGVLALTPEEEQRYIGWGATFLAATVTGVILKALKDHVAAGRAADAGASAEKAKIGY